MPYTRIKLYCFQSFMFQYQLVNIKLVFLHDRSNSVKKLSERILSPLQIQRNRFVRIYEQMYVRVYYGCTYECMFVCTYACISVCVRASARMFTCMFLQTNGCVSLLSLQSLPLHIFVAFCCMMLTTTVSTEMSATHWYMCNIISLTYPKYINNLQL